MGDALLGLLAQSIWLRIYAEAATQDSAESLANSVAQHVNQSHSLTLKLRVANPPAFTLIQIFSILKGVAPHLDEKNKELDFFHQLYSKLETLSFPLHCSNLP